MKRLEKMMDDKEELFKTRTNHHIDLVRKYCKMIDDAFPDAYPEIIDRGNNHDASKFEDPEHDPYVILTYARKTTNDWAKSVSPEEKEKINQATLHHIKNNDHHPEYFCKDVSINKKDRDEAPAKCMDVSEMSSTSAMAEMCADWAAMAEEVGDNTPQEWADKNIGTRWNFTEAQKDLIYKLLNTIWPNKQTEVRSIEMKKLENSIQQAELLVAEADKVTAEEKKLLGHLLHFFKSEFNVKGGERLVDIKKLHKGKRHHVVAIYTNGAAYAVGTMFWKGEEKPEFVKVGEYGSKAEARVALVKKVREKLALAYEEDAIGDVEKDEPADKPEVDAEK